MTTSWSTRNPISYTQTQYDEHILYDAHLRYDGITIEDTDWTNLRIGGSYLTDVSGNYITDVSGNRIIVIVPGGTLPFSEWSGRTQPTTSWSSRTIP